MFKNETNKLFDRAKELEAIKYGKFTLSSGKKSSYYFDGRLLTLSPRGASIAAKILLPIFRTERIRAVGGPTLGADPMVGAIVAMSSLDQ